MEERIKRLEQAKRQQIKNAETRHERNVAAMNTRLQVEIERIGKRFDSEINAAKMADATKVKSIESD